MAEHFSERVAGKTVLNVDFGAALRGTANLHNPECFREICRMLETEEADELRIRGEFNKVFDANHLEIIKEVASAVKQLVGGIGLPPCGRCGPKRRDPILQIREEMEGDPVRAFHDAAELLVLKKHTNLCHQCEEKARKDAELVKTLLGSTRLVRASLKNANAYVELFPPKLIPGFISSYVELEVPKDAKLLEQYRVKGADVRIYERPGHADRSYLVFAPEFYIHENENKILSGILDSISREESRIVDPRRAREHFKTLGKKLLEEHAGKLDDDENERLGDLVARYSAGYGIFEVLLSDEKLQDVYVDSPGNTPVHVYHADYEECVTNIVPSNFELEKLSARFRALSGRPFDESSPVLHAELEDLGVRIAGLREPATFQGIGFAFRRHKSTPWTLNQFVRAGMMDSMTAGLVSFLVDGQRSMLVTGPRGSGKSSLLAALLAEVAPSFRMIVIEDTPELPVSPLMDAGYKIQHLRTQPVLGGVAEKGYELTAEEALRTALRLGESVLVLGEVRGPEAKVLFEAMRVGAAGNVVLGTIHGSSAYDTWDRIVNDLGVPSTSFKATDIVISTAAIRKGDETKRARRLTGVTEVRKDWKIDPQHEGGFSDLVTFDARKDSWKLSKELADSQTLREVARIKRTSVEKALENIEFRAQFKQAFVDRAKSVGDWILGVKPVIDSNIEYLRQVERHVREHGEVDFKTLLPHMKKWLGSYSTQAQKA
ncbi:type II/IV secretion system ATPase subunit [Candidatus Micrarchaeota archaeon]|nr:type II/IV secretion system ATPase subunit [Candidatus Micrarchaeota archaeon]